MEIIQSLMMCTYLFSKCSVYRKTNKMQEVRVIVMENRVNIVVFVMTGSIFDSLVPALSTCLKTEVNLYKNKPDISIMNVILKKQNEDAHHTHMDIQLYCECIIGSKVKMIIPRTKQELKNRTVQSDNSLTEPLKM